jgi:CubicO group peptidase (beta-lactamase class C family)
LRRTGTISGDYSLGFRILLNCSLACITAAMLLSCGQPEPHTSLKSYTGQDSVPELSDSIKNILVKLNAKQKAKQLDSLFRYMLKHGLLNGDVLVAQQGQVIYKNSFGYGKRKPDDTLTLHSAFQMGSSTKPLTATAILMLKERGLLQLSQTVDEFFPGFNYKNITVKDLLTHRSGLSNYMYFCDALYCYKEQPMSNDALLKIMIEKHPPRYFAPNRKFEYSNTNYALLVCIIEKVSGKSYNEFMTGEIFKPLGMDNTWVGDVKTNDRHLNKTIGYETNWKKYDNDYLDGILGDKNIFTTVDDLYLFDQALYTDKLLSKETIKEAYTGASHEYPGHRNYGYGWRLIDEKGGTKIVYHNGWWHGYNNVFWRRLKDKTTVIILSNKITPGIFHIESIMKILDGSGSSMSIFDEDEQVQ